MLEEAGLDLPYVCGTISTACSDILHISAPATPQEVTLNVMSSSNEDFLLARCISRIRLDIPEANSVIHGVGNEFGAAWRQTYASDSVHMANQSVLNLSLF